MKRFLIYGILIAVLCVGTTTAVSVDYASKQVIPVTTARDNANAALLSYVAQGKLGSSAALWEGASLSTVPVIIYDQSGIVYSYLFDVINKNGVLVGEVNAAGNKLIGSTIVSIEKKPRSFDPDVVITKARELSLEKYTDAQVDYIVLVMGQDKEIGVMAIITEQNGLTHRITYDIPTFAVKSDRIAYRGFVDASTTSSVLVSMSSSSATRALQNYDSKTKSIARVVPVMRRVIPVNYLNTTGTRFPGVSTVKSGEKGTIVEGYQSPAYSQGSLVSAASFTTWSENYPAGTSGARYSSNNLPVTASRFLPV